MQVDNTVASKPNGFDEKYMRRAIELAKLGCGFVNPNPMVGAVLVKDNRVIGEGYHRKYGELHAERNAFADCKKRGESAKGADLYVTLEPCCHYGKTPPCTQAVIENEVSRVFIGSNDPNPLVAGQGIKCLQEQGIAVYTEVLREECDAVNEVFFHYISTKTPFVVMKYAMTMDGKIAAYTGKSKWVTGETARHRVQEDRHQYAGIMVGVQTVIADNPMLTCRLENGSNPIRIICDTNLRTPLLSNIVTTARKVPTIIATCCEETSKYEPYIEAGCEVLTVKKAFDKEKRACVDLQDLVKKLGEKKIDSILLEGGATLNWSALKAGIVNKIQTYIAPKLFGGAFAKSAIGGIGVDDPSKAYPLKVEKITQLGEDYLIESRILKNKESDN